MNKFLYTFMAIVLANALMAQSQLLKPSDFLPHDLGEQFTHHYQVVDYVNHVAESSPNVEAIQYGLTNQDRPLMLAFVSSPDNLKNLESIRLNHLSKAGLAEGNEDKLGKEIAIVWLSFGVHGNEAGASESSMNVLWKLADTQNQNTQKYLENTVVILDPSINPDGYSRYTHWYRNVSNVFKNPHMESREHNEPFPGGRVNHYNFDLNRDWAWATQKETRQRLKVYNKWLPHVHVDFHEQFHNSPYYFAPAAQPYHSYINQWQRNFQVEVGKNNAKYFDQEGWLYFTKEVFDLLYPSYGDTYPIFNGGIGMTYEQAGHGHSGRAIEMEHGDTLTLHDRIAHHTKTALSTVEVASNRAEKLNVNFQRFFNESMNSPSGKYKAFVIKGTNSKGKMKKLIELLDRHNIQYGTSSGSKTLTGFDYTTGKNTSFFVASNDLIISAYQPKSILAQVLFEPEPDLVDTLTYDITAWALPYAHGLQAYATTQKVEPNGEYKIADYKPTLSTDEKPYAYVMEWQSMQDVKFLSALLQNDIKVRYAMGGFTVHGKSYPSGTLVANRADNRKMGAAFDSKMRKLANKHEQDVRAVTTGFMDKGSDFGSSNYAFIKRPNIAVVQHDNLDANAFGQVWYYFEQDLSYPVTVLPIDNLNLSTLNNYDVLVLPDGYYNLKSNQLETLNTWTNAGGKLVAIAGAVRAFEDKNGFTLTKYASEEAKNKAQQARAKAQMDARTQAYNRRTRSSLSNFIPGAIFKIKMDNTHPLGFGMSNYYFSLKTTTDHFELLKNTWNVGYIEKDPFLLGFAGSIAQQNLENSVNFAVQDKRRGSVVYLIDNPLYRSFWEQGKFLFSNAVFLVD